jgi:hypothetical protein
LMMSRFNARASRAEERFIESTMKILLLLAFIFLVDAQETLAPAKAGTCGEPSLLSTVMPSSAPVAQAQAISLPLAGAKAFTSEHMDRTLADRSWVKVSWDRRDPHVRDTMTVTGYSSAMDLCLSQTNQTVENLQVDDVCTNQAQSITNFSLHCMYHIQGRMGFTAVGQESSPTMDLMLYQLNWPWAFGVVAMLFYLTNRQNDKIKPAGAYQHCQLGNNCAYLGLVVLHKAHHSDSAGLWNPESTLWFTVVQSYEIFTLVHPVTSSAIALSHFATSWTAFAAFRARSLRGMLFWWFCFEVCTVFVNEYFHYDEADNAVQCMRVSFISDAQHYAINDVIRMYILSPFFVYGYLLPTMLLQRLGF